MFAYWQIEYTTNLGERFLTDLSAVELPGWLENHPGYQVQHIYPL